MSSFHKVKIVETKDTSLMEYNFEKTIFGDVIAGYINNNLCYLAFYQTKEEAIIQLQKRFSKINIRLRENISNKIDLFISNKNQQHHIVLKGTPFQVMVWKELLNIPFSKLTSYQNIATIINNPKAVQAVASAVANNPIAIIIPCHRVIYKNGDTGKYKWGSQLKREIIAWEHQILTNQKL